MRRMVVVLGLGLCSIKAHAQACDFIVDFGAACPVVQGVGLVRPESIQPHDGTGWYASNIGDPFNVGDGFITRIAHDGCGTLDWSVGLKNPRGIDVFQGDLYVADQDRIVVIRIETGIVVKVIQAPTGQVTEWNDPEVDTRDKVLYVSDRSPLPGDTAGIWRIDLATDQITKIASFPLDSRPNGVLVDKGYVVYVDRFGKIRRRNTTTGATTTWPTGLGGLDGIERHSHDTYLVTENQQSNLWLVRLNDDGTVTKTALANGSPLQFADLGYYAEDGAVGVPTLGTHKILFRYFDDGTGLLEPCSP